LAPRAPSTKMMANSAGSRWSRFAARPIGVPQNREYVQTAERSLSGRRRNSAFWIAGGT
jgi:hypothetical protein